MLLTLDELEQPNPALREVRTSAWKGAFLVGSEALLLVRVRTKRAPPEEPPRTLLTTASSLRDTMRHVLPAKVLAVCAATRLESDPILFDACEVWLPAASEGGQGLLFRFDAEGPLRNGRLERVPDVDGRVLYLDLKANEVTR